MLLMVKRPVARIFLKSLPVVLNLKSGSKSMSSLPGHEVLCELLAVGRLNTPEHARASVSDPDSGSVSEPGPADDVSPPDSSGTTAKPHGVFSWSDPNNSTPTVEMLGGSRGEERARRQRRR